jgi:hypothetical protein
MVLKLMNLTASVENLLELLNLRSAFVVCSVPEMLDLMCRALEQSRSRKPETVDVSDQVFEVASPVAMRRTCGPTTTQRS